MRIGIFTAPSTIDSFVQGCQTAKAQGFTDIWAPQIFGLDTMQVIGIAAREVPGLSFGTSVVPTYPRHPMSMAQMALTTAEATGGRFGICLPVVPALRHHRQVREEGRALRAACAGDPRYLPCRKGVVKPVTGRIIFPNAGEFYLDT